ncbi:MAG: GAF domain-containing sensor histidine kinase [Rhodospirillaceae bacterium]
MIIEDAQKEILALVASGKDLTSVLVRTCLLLETFIPGARCSIMLVDEDKRCLIPGAAPSMPEEYIKALHGLPIGPDIGACGTAVATGKTVITEDIARDPKWSIAWEITARFGLAACWSIPLFDVEQRCIGTFAVYHDHPHAPPPSELQVAMDFSNTVSIAIAWQKDRDTLLKSQSAAEAASTAKSTFLAQMSHDLRTPLNAIIGFADVIRVDFFGAAGAGRYRQYAEHIHASGKLLLSLVDSLLDLSRIEAGQLETRTETFGLAELLQDCRETIQRSAPETVLPIRIAETPAGLELIGDRPAIARVILNLLSNAVRHTPSTGSILIETTVSGEDLIIACTDTGAGIPQELIGHLGKPFLRAKTGSRNDNRSGLGLYISHSIIAHHGGVLDIQSDEGCGTTVRIWLPAARFRV